MAKTAKSEYLLAVDTIDERDIEELIDWLRGNPRLTQGELVQEFQREWSGWLGARHSVLVNSGSSANLLMYATLLASGRLKNNKVIVPAVSWATTVAPALQLGFEPIMCDAESDTFGVDPDALARLCEEHDPGAVILVHVLGVPCQMDRILELQQKHGFLLMEDACAATGSTYDGQKVGTFGDLGSFSFYFGHHVSIIEGGMVSSSDIGLRDLMLHLRSHGWAKDLDADAEDRIAREHGASGFNRPFTFYYPGFNLRSSDLNARLGLSQMRKIDEVCRRRMDNHRVYQEMLTPEHGFTLQQNPRAEICSIACVALAQDTQHRERVTTRLGEYNVETRPLGGGNMSRQPFWTARYPAQDFPVADRIAECAFQLPNHPAHSVDDIRDICEWVLSA